MSIWRAIPERIEGYSVLYTLQRKRLFWWTAKSRGLNYGQVAIFLNALETSGETVIPIGNPRGAVGSYDAYAPPQPDPVERR
jgi:hypothetical protein